MFQVSEIYLLRDIYVEVIVRLNVIADDGSTGWVTLHNQSCNYTITCGMGGPLSKSIAHN